VSESIGVAMALVSSSVGGSAAAVTRYLAAGADPIALATVRFGLGFLIVLPVAAAARIRWPRLQDWLGVAGLGVMFFALAIVLYNVALSYTTAARGTLALSTLPLLTMVVGAAFGVEPLSYRKTLGVLVAMLGVAVALTAGVHGAPTGAWRGELIMLGTSLCMALYNVWSRPFIDRSSALGFLTVGMGAGAIALIVVGCSSGAFVTRSEFSTRVASGLVFRGGWGRARLRPLDTRPSTNDSDTRGSHYDRQSSFCRCGGHGPAKRADNLQLHARAHHCFAGIWIAASDPREGTQ